MIEINSGYVTPPQNKRRRISDDECAGCYKALSGRRKIHPFNKVPLCNSCYWNHPDFKTLCKTQAKQYYHLQDDDLKYLKCMLFDNPHGFRKAPMQIYLQSDIIQVSERKDALKQQQIEQDQKKRKLELQDRLSPHKVDLNDIPSELLSHATGDYLNSPKKHPKTTLANAYKMTISAQRMVNDNIYNPLMLFYYQKHSKLKKFQIIAIVKRKAKLFDMMIRLESFRIAKYLTKKDIKELLKVFEDYVQLFDLKKIRLFA